MLRVYIWTFYGPLIPLVTRGCSSQMRHLTQVSEELFIAQTARHNNLLLRLTFGGLIEGLVLARDIAETAEAKGNVCLVKRSTQRYASSHIVLCDYAN